jgi:threonine aldolase
MRFQSAQLAAYLTDGLWLRLAAHSNQRMAELVAGLEPLAASGVRLLERVDVNMAFVELSAAAADRLPDAGILCYRMTETSVRLVTSWQTTADDVASAVDGFRRACEASADQDR